MSGLNRLEIQETRMKLRLRYNPHLKCWEVYTTVHGTFVFKWWKISDSTKEWYVKNFPEIKEVAYE